MSPLPREAEAVEALEANNLSQTRQIEAQRAAVRKAEGVLNAALERERRNRVRQLKIRDRDLLQGRLTTQRDAITAATRAYSDAVHQLCAQLAVSSEGPPQAAHKRAVVQLREQRAHLQGGHRERATQIDVEKKEMLRLDTEITSLKTEIDTLRQQLAEAQRQHLHRGA